MSTFPESCRDDECQCLQSSNIRNGNNAGKNHTRNHKLRPGMSEVDEVIIQGMNSLSFYELQKEQDQLHGVSADITEKTVEVNRMLVTLQDHLQQIKVGTAYERAERMNQDYVGDRDFQMTFLRAKQYDIKEAADQMIRYFEMKADLFGVHKLTKDITLQDLDKDDIECLLNGSYQISAIKDRADRTILVQFPSQRSYKIIDNELRSLFYTYTQIIKSIDCPNSGVVYINYGVGKFREMKNGQDLMKYHQLGIAMPFYTAGFHLCYNNTVEAMVCKAAVVMLPTKMKAKIKVHYGSHMECQYRLSTFGIPQDALPISVEKEEVLLGNNFAWYEACLQKENCSRLAPTPNDNDVLCVGRKVNSSGNDRLLDMATQHADWYNNGNPRERRTLVDLIMGDIRRNGGRFLKLDEQNSLDWQEVPIDEIRAKISQLFRNLKKRAQKSTQKAIPTSDAMTLSDFRDEDVLFGRKYDKPGNELLRQLVEAMASEYNAATRGRKKQIADHLVQEVKKRGGRFLKPIEGGKWVEVSDKLAETKVSARFRNLKRREDNSAYSKTVL